jgi:hypothetical protein
MVLVYWRGRLVLCKRVHDLEKTYEDVVVLNVLRYCEDVDRVDTHDEGYDGDASNHEDSDECDCILLDCARWCEVKACLCTYDAFLGPCSAA